jgi:hypothetical protein
MKAKLLKLRARWLKLAALCSPQVAYAIKCRVAGIDDALELL